MTVIETIFPSTKLFLDKTNEDLALHVAQLWLDGKVSATPVGRDTELAEGDLVLSGDTLWTPAAVWANETSEDDWDPREGFYRPIEVWLQLVGGTETEHLSWILNVPGTTYKVNLI